MDSYRPLPSPNSAGLHDDDNVDFLLEVEQVFDVEFTDAEAAKIYTVGDLYDGVMQKLPFSRGEKCHSQIAFYRLRSALAFLAPDLKLAASTPIKCVTSNSPKKTLRFIEKATGLKSPSRRLSFMGKAGFLMMGVCIVAALAALLIFEFLDATHWAIWPVLSMMFVLSALLVFNDPGKFSKSDATLGGLSKSLTQRNYGKLIRLGGRHDADSAWLVLTKLVTEWSVSIREEEIRQDTVLLESTFRTQSKAIN